MSKYQMPKQKIARKLILYLISASVLITLVITTVQLYRDYQHEINLIGHRFHQIEQANIVSLSDLLWETNQQRLEIQLQGLMGIPDMQYLAIINNGKVIVSTGEPKTKNILSNSYPLSYEDQGELQKIGRLEVVVSLDGVYQRLLENVWLILVSNAIKIFIIVALLFFIFHRLVIRHINQLADQLADTDNLSTTIVLGRSNRPEKQDEFDVLMDAFNTMRLKVSDSDNKVNLCEDDLRLYETIMSTTTDLMSYIDLNYHYQSVNDAYLQFHDKTRDEIIGRSVASLLGNEYFANHAKPNLDKTFAGAHVSWIACFQNSRGEKYDVEVHCYPYYGNQAKVQGAVINVRDITLRQQAEKDKLRNIQVYQALAQQGPIHFSHFLASSLNLLHDVFQSNLVFVGRLMPDGKRIKTECVLQEAKILENFIYPLNDTPCERVFENCEAMIYQDVAQHFAKDQFIVERKMEAYFGVPLVNSSNQTIGVLAVLDTQAHKKEDWHSETLNVFAARIASEMERADAVKSIENYNEELEKQVYVRTVELQESIKELESFSYSVSHDLRTPLRAINGFSQILLEDDKANLSESGISQLTRICAASKKMGELIDSLLKLSRISRQPLDFVKVNLSQLANEIFDAYKLDHTFDLSINVEEDIYCYCDLGLIKVALANLIDNAIKYSVKNGAAMIEMGTQHLDGVTTFYIKDNGVGFDERFAKKLFLPFQRVHEGADFNGSGIGLATVQRIFNRHGGSVWAESKLGQGATFYFRMGEFSKSDLG